MLDNSFKLNNAFVLDGSALSPYVVPDPVVPNTDNDAFYASVLSQSEDPVGVYEQIKMQQEANDGMSDIIINVRNYYKQQKDSEKALLIEEIIADETIDRESKKQLLESFTLGEDKFTLQDEYLNFLTNSRLAEQPEVTAEDLEYVDFKINKNDELDQVINKCLNHPTYVICEVFTDPDQDFAPKLASKVDKDGKISSPSLEEMSPFLPDSEHQENLNYLKS